MSLGAHKPVRQKPCVLLHNQDRAGAQARQRAWLKLDPVAGLE
jgi:hypothetical protein